MVNRYAFWHAIDTAITHHVRGHNDEAAAWMAEACRIIGCGDILNSRGRELRRDYHAGPRDAVIDVWSERKAIP